MGALGFLLAAFAFPTMLYAQNDTLNLLQAINIAQENALSQKQVQMEHIVAQNNLSFTQATLKPQLSLAGTLPNFYKTTSAITQPDGTISFLPISQDNSSLGLNLSQRVLATNTLFYAESRLRRYSDFTENGVRNFNTVPFRVGINQPLNAVNNLKWDKKINLLETEIARDNLDINREKIAAETASAYFDLLAAQVNHEIAKTNTENSEKIYKIAIERDKLGKISKSDFLQLELSLNAAKQDAISARRAVIRANAAFKETMGWAVENDEIFGLTVPETIDTSPLNPHDAAEKAWLRRPEQKQLKKLLFEAERALETARKNNGWQGTLSATFGWVGTGNAFGVAYELPKVENYVQLSLNVPILDGGRRKYSTQAALEKQKYVEAENAFTEQAFKQNVRQLAQQFQEVKEEVTLGEKSLQLARERYEIANQRYILNDISITDLSIAFSERDNTWRGYINLLRAYWTTYYALRQITLENF